LVQIGESNL